MERLQIKILTVASVQQREVGAVRVSPGLNVRGPLGEDWSEWTRGHRTARLPCSALCSAACGPCDWV